MTSVEVTNFRPTIEDDLVNLNALFDLRLPDGTLIRNVGVSDDGSHIALSGIANETPWREAILAEAEIAMGRHLRDVQHRIDAARLVAPRPRGS